jgi:hypothetical protein
MIGSAVEACTRATISCELEIEVIIQAAPTAWINPPKFDAMLAIHIVRKVLFVNGASVAILSGTIWPWLLFRVCSSVIDLKSVNSSAGA